MNLNLFKSLRWFFRLPSSFFEKVFETKVLSIVTAAIFFILIGLGVKLVETTDISYLCYGLGVCGVYVILFVIVTYFHYKHNKIDYDEC